MQKLTASSKTNSPTIADWSPTIADVPPTIADIPRTIGDAPRTIADIPPTIGGPILSVHDAPSPGFATAVSPSLQPRRGYVRRELGERRTHVFRLTDGREMPCAGPGRCRECNREAGQ